MEWYDDIVLGFGLAGAAVAWHLRWLGRRVLVIDRESPSSASRVAAGLITPVTGLRLVKSPHFDELYPVAESFYRRTEAETGESFFIARNAVRLFSDEHERDVFDTRQGSLGGCVSQPNPLVNPDWFSAPHGGFEMSSAARLDVPGYLDASRDHFARSGRYFTADINVRRDIELTTSEVRLPRLGLSATRIVCCQGLDAHDNPWFPHVRFAPAKGEVLVLRIPKLAEDRVVHRGVWLAPMGEGHFRAGATYDRDDLTPSPTERGRTELVTRLREFLRLPFEVIGHTAGVRPVAADMKPIAEVHPAHPQLAILNGLGSKGSLLAPALAARLVGQFARCDDSTTASGKPVSLRPGP